MKREIGVAADWRNATIDGLRRIGEESDSLGYDYFWVPEAWGLEAFTSVAHVLSVTKRISVGTGIVNVFSRSASLIGMGCVTLDQMAPSRFMLGLGTSGRAVIEEWHGVRFENPTERLKDYVAIIRKVTKGEPVDYSGKTVAVFRFRLFTKSSGSPEIYLGVMGDKGIQLSAEIADGPILTMYPGSKLQHAVDIVKKSENKKRIFAYYRTLVVNSDSSIKLAELELAKYISFYVVSMGRYYARHLERFGFGEDINRIKSARATGDREGGVKAVSKDLLEGLSFIGSADEIWKKLESIPKEVVPVLALGTGSREQVEASIHTLKSLAS